MSASFLQFQVWGGTFIVEFTARPPIARRLTKQLSNDVELDYCDIRNRERVHVALTPKKWLRSHSVSGGQ